MAEPRFPFQVHATVRAEHAVVASSFLFVDVTPSSLAFSAASRTLSISDAPYPLVAEDPVEKSDHPH